MSVLIKLNESSATLRCVPLPPLVQSNGTSSCTNESGNTFYFSVGGVYYGSGGSISAVSAPIGLYECLFSASKVSVVGQGAVHYSSGTALPARTAIEIVRTDSYDSMRMGLFALPNVAAEAAGGLITSGTGAGQLSVSNGSVGLKAQTHSQATVGGINNILAGTYSDVSFSVRNGGIQPVSVGAGNYSGMSVEVKTKGIATSSIETVNVYSYLSIGAAMEVGSTVSIHAGTHSNVTIQGVSNTSAAADILTDIWAPGSHSGVTIQGISNYKNISNVTIADGNYSGVTVRIQGMSYSGLTIDGVRIVATPGERSIASSLLSTNIGGSRLVQEAIFALRNRVQISGSTMTVYLADDSTSAWTATVSTGTATIYGIDPGIA